MKARMLCLVVVAFFASFSFSIAEAMTAERVIENVIVRYEKGMEGVDDFTMVTDVEATTYHKRAVIEGRTIFKTRSEMEMMGIIKSVTIYDGVYVWWGLDELKKEKIGHDPHCFLASLKAAQVKYIGIEKIDELKAHILDFKDLKMMSPVGVYKASGRVWVDAKDWIIRKVELEYPVKMTLKMEDFRKVNGMLMPHQTVVTVPVPGAPEVTPEIKQEIRKKLEEIQKALAEMSPEERARVEKTGRPQIEMMERILAGAGFEMVTVVKVKDVKVNTGLSDDLFDGSKLR